MIPASFARKTVAIMVLVALMCAAGFVASFYYQMGKSSRIKISEATSAASERMTKSTVNEAVRSLEAQNNRDKQTIENRNKINEAENANDSAGDAGDIGLNVVCKRAIYRHHPACMQRENSAKHSG